MLEVYIFIVTNYFIKLIIFSFVFTFLIKPLIDKGYLPKWGYIIPTFSCLAVGLLATLF